MYVKMKDEIKRPLCIVPPFTCRNSRVLSRRTLDIRRKEAVIYQLQQGFYQYLTWYAYIKTYMRSHVLRVPF